MTCILRFVIMSPVGGAAWKTEEEVAAHMKIEEHMENHGEEDRQTIVRQEDRQTTIRQEDRRNSGGAGAYAAEKKKTTHDTICPVDHINHCSNSRNHFVETLQPIKRTI